MNDITQLTLADAPTPRTAEMIAQEPLLLGAIVTRLVMAERKLAALVALHIAHGDEYAAEVVEGWRTNISDLSDVIDGAYGETFIDTGRES